MKKIGLILIATLIFGAVTSASALTISPKLSYVGWLGIGAEFSPLYKITKDVDLMGEVNWDFWTWNGGAGYIYGELNAVYNAQPFTLGEGKGATPLKPYVGGGLILGFPMGTANFGGNFSGGIGFGIFGGVTGQLDPYTWFAQLKYGSAPITFNYTIPGFGIIPDQKISETANALGAGMEFGVRLPL